LGAATHGRVIAIDPAKGPSSAKQAGAVSADLKRPVGGETSKPGGPDPVVEIRISVGDATQASELMRRLARLFDPLSISFDWPQNEVRVESEWESRAVAGVLEVVEAWLGADGAESATLSIGERSYTLGSSSLAVTR
jgi:hypothetical protein